MGEKLVVGPIDRGVKTNRTAFNIDDDSFPTLINAYQWRGRVKRKRGTSPLGRGVRYFDSTSASYNPGTTTQVLVSGVGNLLTGFASSAIESTAMIVPGSVTITDSTTMVVYTDPAKDGTLSPGGTINYATGSFTISPAANDTVTATFKYYPGLVAMGFRDLALTSTLFPGNLAFDTVYSYNVLPTAPYQFYNVSFYANPPTGTYPSYVAKSVWTPTTWNGQNYQQFWTVNYEGAFWATNGITVPFIPASSNIGMQFKPIVSTTVVSGVPPATVTLQITGHGLVVGDFVFVNEVVTTTGINFQTGYVITITDANNVIVEFPKATIASNGTGGIAQYLTNRSDKTKDCLRWYDGDPTNGSGTGFTTATGLGWINFMPPLSEAIYSIAELPAAQYYLVGARMIVPYKDRLNFIGPVVQTSTGSPIYLQDTIIYSQNGTPYYTCSFSATPNYPLQPVQTTGGYFPLLVPTNQTATPSAYFEDETGFGGFISAGLAQPIITAAPNEDVIILGFGRTTQARLVYTGNDIVPYNMFIINSELPSSSTFSAITLDKGVMTRGTRGFIITNQVEAGRFDLDIPDEVFQMNNTNNGSERVCAVRDFENEWCYFTYSANQNMYVFPNQTLLYNYRDNSWAVFYENYTTYGIFRRVSGLTWATLDPALTWATWTAPWNSGNVTLLDPDPVGGNQQGYFLIRDDDTTSEAPSLAITNIQGPGTITGITQAASAVVTINNSYSVGQQVMISGVVGMTQLNGNIYGITAASSTTITLNVNSTAFTAYSSGGTATPSVYCINHCLNGSPYSDENPNGDYIVISGCLGTIGAAVNGNIYSINNPSTNNFFLNPPIPSGSYTYLGNGQITRMYIPIIQTKQFPTAWSIGRKTRIGVQQYLLSTTNKGQITLQIFLSMNDESPYNDGPIVPAANSTNNSLIYSQVLYTCPESTNLGLTPANVNLQMPTAQQQQQIWHRVNTSLIGDVVQLGFTLSDAQMRDPTFSNQMVEIELHGFIIDMNASQMLS